MAALVVAGGCQLVTLVDRDRIEGEGGAGGQGGGGPTCVSADDCLGTDTTCSIRTCNNGACGVELTTEATPCTEDGGAVCDGDGKCVACIDDNQCSGGEMCDLMTNTCTESQCNDETMNGDETDVDCGGPMCTPCANGLSCMLPSDCASGFCDSNSCAPCTADQDCETGTYCEPMQMACVAKKSNGESCTGNNECGTGQCTDDVCCESPCQAVCQTCGAMGSEGTCTIYAVGTDPENECGADVCSGASSCRCNNNQMDGDETDVDCGGGTCAVCMSGQACMAPSDCQSNTCLGNMTCQ